MYTRNDIPLELEQRVKDTHLRLLDAVKPRSGEMRILASMRAEEVIRDYEAIIRDLPIILDEKISFRGGGGEVYLFKDDEHNARTLIGIAFGHGVARGAYSIYPLEQRDDFETLERKAFTIKPGYNNRAITAFLIPGCIPIVTPPADLTGTGIRTYVLSPDWPPRISVHDLSEYGKFLGYHLNAAYVESVFERIKSLELPGSGDKQTWLTVKIEEQPKAIAPTLKGQLDQQFGRSPPYIQQEQPKQKRWTRRTDITKETLIGFIARKMSIDEMAESLRAPYHTVHYHLSKFGLRSGYRESRFKSSF